MVDRRIDPQGIRPGYPLSKLGRSGASNGQVPVWNSTTGQWEPGTAAGGETLPVSIIDAKGDLIVGTANDTAVRKAVGSDGQVLTADAASTGGVKWAAAPGGSAENFGGTFAPQWASGRWYEPQLFGSYTTAATAADSAHWTAIFVPASVTVQAASCEVTAGATGSTIYMGVYADDHGAPGALISNFGSVSGGGTGVRTITGLSVALSRGIYWLAQLSTGGTPTVRAQATPATAALFGGTAAGQTTVPIGYAQGSVSSLPTNGSGSAPSTNNRRRVQIQIA